MDGDILPKLGAIASRLGIQVMVEYEYGWSPSRRAPREFLV